MNAIVEFQDCLNMAQELLATKIRDNYYAFKFISEELNEGVVYSNPLNDKEVARLRALKRIMESLLWNTLTRCLTIPTPFTISLTATNSTISILTISYISIRSPSTS